MQETNIQWVENKVLKGFNAVRGHSLVGTVMPVRGKWAVLGGKMADTLEQAKALLIEEDAERQAAKVEPGSTRTLIGAHKGERWNRALGRYETVSYDQRMSASARARQLARAAG